MQTRARRSRLALFDLASEGPITFHSIGILSRVVYARSLGPRGANHPPYNGVFGMQSLAYVRRIIRAVIPAHERDFQFHWKVFGLFGGTATHRY